MKLILSIFFSLISMNVLANSPTNESVEELLSLTSSREMIENINTRKFEHIYRTFKENIIIDESNAHMFDEYKKSYFSLIESELSWSKLKPYFVEAYSSIFTQSEINDIVTFYKTPAGEKMLNVTPVLMQKITVSVQSHTDVLIPKLNALQEKLMSDLKAQMESNLDSRL
jgi:hypothetical protein